MTLEQKMRELLEQHGMWSDGLEATMKEAKESDLLKDTMRERWNDDVEGYPQTLVVALWLNVRSLALNWVDANCPEAWYRPMLAGEDIGELSKAL